MSYPLLENYQSFWQKKKKILFPWKQAFLITSIWLCLLCLLTLFHFFKYCLLKEKENQVKQQAVLLNKEQPPINPQFLATLDGSTKIYRQGIGSYLAYLSTFHSEGTWLTEITVNLQTGFIQLTGHTLSANSADDFLNHLQQADSPYANWKIGSAQLTRSINQPKDSRPIRFSRSSSFAAQPTFNPYFDFSLSAQSKWYVAPPAPKGKKS